MKKIILTLLLVATTIYINAQNCGSGSITLATQADVDTFVTTYSGTCDTINGSLYIGTSFGVNDINDISGLSFLTTITATLTISYTNLSNVNGLDNITDIGYFLIIQNNAALTNIGGFSGLTSLGNSLSIQNNAALTNVDGFSGLTSVGSYLSIYLNAALTNIDGFSGLTSVGSYLYIYLNTSLTNIDGLENLLEVNGYLTIQNNAVLDECCIVKKFIEGSKFLSGAINISGNNTNCSSIPIIITSCSDIDDDDVIDSNDNCPTISNPNQEDTDNDGIGDVCDNCPNDVNPAQTDSNNNGIGDACENSGTGADSGTDNGGVGIGTTDPKSQLEITKGDVFIKNIHRGVIMKSPDGKCFRFQPNSEGILKSKEITCPDN